MATGTVAPCEVVIPRGETRVVRANRDTEITIPTAIVDVTVSVKKGRPTRITVDDAGVVTWVHFGDRVPSFRPS